MTKNVTLWSLDKKSFKLSEDEMKAVEEESPFVKKSVLMNEKVIFVPVGSKVLRMVIAYCKHQAELRQKKQKKEAGEEEEALDDDDDDDDDDYDVDVVDVDDNGGTEEDGGIEKKENDKIEWGEELTKKIEGLCLLESGLTLSEECALVDKKVKRWIKSVLQPGQDMLFEVITAADELKIWSLLDLVCPFMLDMMRNKDRAQVYELFNIKSAYTQEDMDEIIKKNKSMFLVSKKKKLNASSSQ